MKKELYLTHIAFVHDWLYHMGGAEAVFLDLIQKEQKKATKGNKRQQKAVVFTLFSDKKFLEVGGESLEIITTLPRWMFSVFQYFEKHRVPVLSKLFDYRNLMFFYPVLVWILRQKVQHFGPDEMVVSSFAAVKNILPKGEVKGEQKGISERMQRSKVKGDHTLQTLGVTTNTREGRILQTTKTTLYLHSPMQYIWDYYEDNVRKLQFPIKQCYQLITPVLRRWDKTVRNYDRVICNSHYTAAGAHRLYGREYCEVQYPIIDPQYLQAKLTVESDYYVFIGRLVRFAKELDLIIRVFNQTGDKLVIIGSGPDEAYLRSIAGPNIEFKGQINDVDEKISIIGRSRGLINLTRESFGMVTAEALCLGVPVFGYNEGGSVELIDGQSGCLIGNKKLDHVIEQFAIFKQKTRDRHKISERMRQKLTQAQS